MIESSHNNEIIKYFPKYVLNSYENSTYIIIVFFKVKLDKEILFSFKAIYYAMDVKTTFASSEGCFSQHRSAFKFSKRRLYFTSIWFYFSQLVKANLYFLISIQLLPEAALGKLG